MRQQSLQFFCPFCSHHISFCFDTLFIIKTEGYTDEKKNGQIKCRDCSKEMRQRDRETETDRQRQRDIKRERERERERERGGEGEGEKGSVRGAGGLGG